MIFSQIVGAIVGMEIWRALLEEFDEEGVASFTDAPYLRPTTPHYWQAGVFEFVVTWCFVMANIMTKDSSMKPFTCAENGWLAGASICVSLCAQMLTAGAHSGAVLNPAMSISQYIFGETLNSEVNNSFWGAYMCAPILGGLMAGAYSFAHHWVCANYPDGAEAPAAEKKEK